MKLGLIGHHWNIDINLKQGVWGAKVAGIEFLKAVLFHASQIDGVTMFVSPQIAKDWENYYKLLHQCAGRLIPFEVRTIDTLPKLVKEDEFIAFHTDLVEWKNILNVRNALKADFPCTATAHTISYAFLIPHIQIGLEEATERDRVICLSEAQAKALLNLTDKRIRIHRIPLGVDITRFKPIDREICRSVLQLPKDRIIILSLGRFSANDKADLLPLLRSFANLSLKIEKSVLLLAGDDRRGYASHIKRFVNQLGIDDKVIIMTNVPEIAKPLVYNASDAFVIVGDSIQESFGIALIEAMACGIPVVASDWDGFRELIIHGETGLLVPTWWGKCDSWISSISTLSPWDLNHLFLAQTVAVDINLLEDALLALVENPDMREEMGISARQRVESMFDWKIIIPKYERLWLDLRNNPTSPLVDSDLHIEAKYWETFEHYPSNKVCAKTSVRLTTIGKRIRKNEDQFFIYSEMKPILQKDLIERLLNLIYLEGEIEIEKLYRKLHKNEELVLYHLLWLCKQGAVKLCPPLQ